MNKILIILSFLGLALTILPTFFVFTGAIPWQTHANLMTAGMVLWFATAPFWVGKKKKG
jgi:hypothetical protein